MALSVTLTAVRSDQPHWPTVLTTLRQSDATIALSLDLEPGTLTATLYKATDWTGAQITGAQNVFNTATSDTPQIRAQFEVDAASIFHRAAWLTLLDQINTIRAALSPPLPAITVNQALSAIRTKAGTLS